MAHSGGFFAGAVTVVLVQVGLYLFAGMAHSSGFVTGAVTTAIVGFYLFAGGRINLGTGLGTSSQSSQEQNSTEAPVESMNPPSGVTKLNDSVWKLYSPTWTHEVQIIFFHGLQPGDFENAFWRTWVSTENEQLVWPQKWLTIKFPLAQMLSVSYNSSAKSDAGQTDMYALGENLVNDIIWNLGCGQNCPVFLVGHSLGGIVIKQFILSAIKMKYLLDPDQDKMDIQRISTFLDNFKGAFFYATPHGGSRVADFASLLQQSSKVLGLLRTLNTQRTRINEEFSKQRRNWKARTYGVGEHLPTTYLGFNEVVIEEPSARLDVDGYYTHTVADHFTVCKARDENDSAVIGKLTKFITDTLPSLNRPAGVIKLNDSVWELYSPKESPTMEIIFFHGLQLGDYEHAHWKTWVATTDEQLLWPQKWLKIKFPRARILSVSYNLSAKRDYTGQTDKNTVEYVVKNLMSDIILCSECGQDLPVVFVGHSLGGIVIKKFMLDTVEMQSTLDHKNDHTNVRRISTFFDNCKGAFFYATPHSGSNLEDFVSLLPERSEVLQFFRILNSRQVNINAQFDTLSTHLDLQTYGVGEGLRTRHLNFNEKIVPEESARHKVNGYYTHMDADHFTVCRARDENDSVVIGKLTKFITDIQRRLAEAIQATFHAHFQKRR
ncbi:unnamed protein product [Calypogeia fissa]